MTRKKKKSEKEIKERMKEIENYSKEIFEQIGGNVDDFESVSGLKNLPFQQQEVIIAEEDIDTLKEDHDSLKIISEKKKELRKKTKSWKEEGRD